MADAVVLMSALLLLLLLTYRNPKAHCSSEHNARIDRRSTLPIATVCEPQPSPVQEGAALRAEFAESIAPSNPGKTSSS